MNAFARHSHRSLLLVLAPALALALGCKPKASTVAPTPAPAPAAPPVPAKTYPAPPPPSEPRPINFPSVESFNIDKNGLGVYVVENHEVPLVDINIVVKVGHIDGLVAADLTAEMLTQGTKKRPKAKLDEAFALLGAQLNVAADPHQTVISTRVLSKDVPAALELLDDVVRNPRFEASALDRVRTQYQNALIHARSDQSTLAEALFAQVAYPGGHPYGHILANDDEVTGLDLDSIRYFHNVYYRANNSRILLSGDISVENAKNWVNKAMGKWSFAKDDELPPNPLKSYSVAQFQDNLPTDYQVHVIDLPTTSTEIVFGNVSMTRMDPNWARFQVVNRILGGNSSARLFSDLREKKKLTYGVYSHISQAQSLGLFTISTQTTAIDQMVRELFAHTRKIREEVPTAAEFEAAARSLVQHFPLELETATQIIAKVSQQLTYYLPQNYWQEYRNQLLSLKAEEVPALASQYIYPVPVIVMVGPIAEIEAQIKKVPELASGTIVRYDTKLNPI
jgi:predicted Zn-dependent peptidase